MVQQMNYYNFNDEQVKLKRHAYYYRIFEYNTIDSDKAVVKSFYIDGQIKSEVHYESLSKELINGISTQWHSNGQLKSRIEIKNGKFDGELNTYFENGQQKRADWFENGKFISGKCFDLEGFETLHYDYEILPEFPGGINSMMQYLATQTRYPFFARFRKIHGTVLLFFYVRKDGCTSDLRILRSIHKSLDNAALNVIIKMPKWIPGVRDGEKDLFSFILPINFQLK